MALTAGIGWVAPPDAADSMEIVAKKLVQPIGDDRAGVRAVVDQEYSHATTLRRECIYVCSTACLGRCLRMTTLSSRIFFSCGSVHTAQGIRPKLADARQRFAEAMTAI
jgi:hypothetical protein